MIGDRVSSEELDGQGSVMVIGHFWFISTCRGHLLRFHMRGSICGNYFSACGIFRRVVDFVRERDIWYFNLQRNTRILTI